MIYEAFISRFPNVKKTARGVLTKCPSHEDGTASLSIGRANDGGVLVKCFAGCTADSICASLGLKTSDLFAEEPARQFFPPVSKPISTPSEKPTIEKIYSYTDALGRELFQAIRLKPKSFRQRHQKDGQWIWNMDGVERVLYRLAEIVNAKSVWIVEGEKDADTLASLGFVATCNVGGAGKWLDGYTATLAGKEVILCGDNDEPGRKHMELVFESIAGKAKSVKFVKLPESFKDVSDFAAANNDAKEFLSSAAAAAVPHIGGVRLPVYSMADIEPLYKRQVADMLSVSLNLSKWLPSFFKIRPLVRGELCLILADTGGGKTAILQNIAMTAGFNLPTLMFEIELPAELLFERFFAIKARVPTADVEAEYRNNDCLGEVSVMGQFPNLYICPESKITIEELESIIVRSELKIGCKPVLVLIDYVQLIQGLGNRYEKTSAIAEGLKVLAKTTKTIIVVTSQIARPQGESPEIGLHSGRDSSSLENSAGLVIGAWRDSDDRTLMKLRVLKSTKGGAGMEIDCDFIGDQTIIKQRGIATP